MISYILNSIYTNDLDRVGLLLAKIVYIKSDTPPYFLYDYSQFIKALKTM